MKELRWLESGVRPVLRIEPCADDGPSIVHSAPVIKYVRTIQAPMEQERVQAGNSRAASSQKGRWGWNGGQWGIQWWHTSGPGSEPNRFRSPQQACRALSKSEKVVWPALLDAMNLLSIRNDVNSISQMAVPF